MPGFRVFPVMRGVMSSAPFVGSGGGGGTDLPPPSDPVPPAMPLVAPAGWVRQADTQFPIDVAEGNFGLPTSGYTGNPTADDRGRMQFSFYPWPTYHDTRSKQNKTITITADGSANITSSGAFTAANYVYAGTGVLGGSYISKTGTLLPDTRILSVTNASAAVANKNVPAGTWVVTTTPDFGRYDERRYSVKNGRLKLRMDTTADGFHHVGALRPKLNNLGQYWDVLGGAFELCMRVPTAMPGYKMASLLYRGQSVGGEIDFPEQDFDGGLFAGMFVHFDDNSGQFAQRVSTTDIVGTAWHVYRFEWRPFGGPGGTNPALSTVKAFIDGVQVGTTATGVNVPSHPMHWVWQVESNLKYTFPIPDSSAGTVEYAYALFDNPA